MTADPFRAITTLAQLKALAETRGLRAVFFLDHASPERNAEALQGLMDTCGFHEVVAFAPAGSPADSALPGIAEERVRVVTLPAWRGGWLRPSDVAAARRAATSVDYVCQSLDYDLTGFSADFDRPRRGRVRKTLLELSVCGLLRSWGAPWLMINREYAVVRIARWPDLLNRTSVRPLRLAAYWLIVRAVLAAAWLVARPRRTRWHSLALPAPQDRASD